MTKNKSTESLVKWSLNTIKMPCYYFRKQYTHMLAIYPCMLLIFSLQWPYIGIKPHDSDYIGSKGITTHWFVLCLWLYQRCRVKLWDHMVEENCEVCRPRLQRLNTLETGTLAIDLRKGIHLLDLMMIMWPKNRRHFARYLFLWGFKVVVFCSNNLRVYEVRRATTTVMGIGVLCDIIEIKCRVKQRGSHDKGIISSSYVGTLTLTLTQEIFLTLSPWTTYKGNLCLSFLNWLVFISGMRPEPNDWLFLPPVLCPYCCSWLLARNPFTRAFSFIHSYLLFFIFFLLIRS